MPDPTHPITPTTLNTLYFAFGTNLSPTQLSLRCTNHPHSSRPIAIARLPHYKWFIQRRGCANIKSSPHTSDNEVQGVLYAMHPSDIAILDTYEGVDPDAPVSSPPSISRPTEQGRGRHNKVYLDVEIVRWLVDEHGDYEDGKGTGTVRALVYVDEGDIEEGVVRDNYVGRMNRGVREAVELGLSEEWVKKVVRRWVVEGGEAEEGYVGGENRGL